MKIAHISDLHLDKNAPYVSRDISEVFIEYVNTQNYDILLISGDLSDNYQDNLILLDKIKAETERPVYFVPGNHDLATLDGCTDDIYQQYLAHESVLIGSPLVLENRFAIVAGLGWYDYSFGPEGIDEADFPELRETYWWDGGKFSWKDDDLSRTWKANIQLRKDLETVKGIPTWVMTHFVPYQKALFYKDYWWDMCNAFLGAAMTGETIDSFKDVTHVSFGHTHFRNRMEDHHEKKIIVNPLGYQNEWKNDSFHEELASIFRIVEV